MLSKRARPYDPEGLSKRARLRRNLEDIFASGQLSADRLTEVCKDINRIDPVSFPDVARVPARGRNKHQSRWWRRRLKKKCMDASLLGTSEGLGCKDWPRTIGVDGISSPT